jgi:hypothetical protein
LKIRVWPHQSKDAFLRHPYPSQLASPTKSSVYRTLNKLLFFYEVYNEILFKPKLIFIWPQRFKTDLKTRLLFRDKVAEDAAS